ncbi:MAG: hypothetical protein JWQ97_1357 [Phenylobacterium sp.]|nr:hypothetical protein [Phenylobacterium sp.]
MSVNVKAAGLETDIERSIMASLTAAEARARPYTNWRLENLFPEPVARSLADLPFAPTDLAGVSGRRELHNDDRRYFAGEVLADYAVARRVADAFQSPRVARAFARKTGAELAGTYLRVEYALDLDGFWLEPHTDLGVKALTLLIQLPDEGQAELGTDLYETPSVWCDRAAFDWNGALLFVPSDRTWHGFEPRPIAGVRRSVIVNYVTEDWRAREQLAFPSQPLDLP